MVTMRKDKTSRELHTLDGAHFSTKEKIMWKKTATHLLKTNKAMCELQATQEKLLQQLKTLSNKQDILMNGYHFIYEMNSYVDPLQIEKDLKIDLNYYRPQISEWTLTYTKITDLI